ncbi:nucleotidyltransferase domain-containing protein [Leptospira sp. WS92.C1]
MSREELIEKIRFAIAETAIRAYLFGSVVRNEEHAYSDVDLILLTNTDLSFLKRQELFPELFRLPIEMNLFVYTEEEWEKIRDQSQFPGFWKSAFADMISIL